jgi:hypothetical protein
MKNEINARNAKMEKQSSRKSHIEDGWAPAMSLALSKTPKRRCSMLNSEK